MESKRLPNSKSTDDLLKDLEVSTFEGTNYLDAIHEYISVFKLQPGNNEVNSVILLELFKLWSIETVDKMGFNRKIALYFTSIQTHRKLYLKINKTAVELLQLINNIKQNKRRNKTKSSRYKKHYEDYLSFYNIKKGTFYLEGFILYHLYDKWVYNNRKKSLLTKQNFVRFCSIYFDHKIVNKNKEFAYAIDRSILDYISIESIKNLKKGRDSFHAKKKKPKKSNKISSSTT